MELQNLTRRRVSTEHTVVQIQPDPRPAPIITQQQVQRRDVGTSTHEQSSSSLIATAIRKMKLVGLKQAFHPDATTLERILWVGVFLFCLCLTVTLTFDSVEDYIENPTSNTLHDDIDISRFPFAGVTVTRTTIFEQDGIKDTISAYVNSANRNPKYDTGPTITWSLNAIKKLLFVVDHFCEMVTNFAKQFGYANPRKSLNLKEIGDGGIKEINMTIKDNRNDKEMKEHVMPFIKKNSLDCNSILVACMWEGDKKNCEEIFVPVQTDVGVGCSFNRIPEEILRNSSGLMSLLYTKRASLNETKEWQDYQIDKELVEALDRFKKPRKFPRTQSKAGMMKGLSFLLVHGNTSHHACAFTNSDGFLISVHSPFEEPEMIKSGVTAPAGHEVLIKVKGGLSVARQDLKSVSIKKRNCVFQSESPLKIFTRYTLTNCRKECLARRIVAICKCHQLSMSSGNNETICGPMEVDCVANETRRLDQDGYATLCGDLKCLPPCNDLSYETSVSYLPYGNEDKFDFSEAPPRFQSLDNFRTSIIHVTMDSDRVATRERKRIVAMAFLVGVIGGILGFALEFSMASVFNVLAGLGMFIAPVYGFHCWRRCSSPENGFKVPSAPQRVFVTVPTYIEVGTQTESCEESNDDELMEVVLHLA